MLLLQEPLKHVPKCRVELHVHLDGAIRHETIWEVMRRKDMKLPGRGSLADLKAALKVKEPKDLYCFLRPFQIFLPAIIDDLELMERISYELVEDKANDNVAYCEVRFSPHLLLSGSSQVYQSEEGQSQANGASEGTAEAIGEKGEVTPDQILQAVLKGLARGEEEFGTKTRVILCCIRGKPDTAWDVLRMCEEYRGKGVVGIDIAGDELLKENTANPVEVAVFEAAREKGIHRTAHAGEADGAESVRQAVEVLGAERIGHGYRVLEDDEIYQMCLKEEIHFEVCPHSSYLSGAIKGLTIESKRHPVFRFAEDGASFSISTDDSTLTHSQLTDEYALLASWGFTEAHLARANFQAALHSFLPLEEKKELIDNLKNAYGVVHCSLPQASPTSPSPSASSPSTTRTSTPPLKPSVTLGTWAERA